MPTPWAVLSALLSRRICCANWRSALPTTCASALCTRCNIANVCAANAICWPALGAVALATPAGAKRRTIYNLAHGTNLPGTLARGEGSAKSKDKQVNEAYDYSGATYDFYSTVFGRNSVDDRGMRLDSSVHYSTDYDNAFWNGMQMVYGDGDGTIFDRFTKCLDVIGHELTHGVTQYEAGLEYQDQPGALNESFSDVFGVLVKQWKLKQTADKADWLIGAGLLAKGIKGVALRSMKAPGTAYDDPNLGKDPQPDHMKNFYKGHQDNGGVHINSGIPNHAFYLVATALGGNAWEKGGKDLVRHALQSPASELKLQGRGESDASLGRGSLWLHQQGVRRGEVRLAAGRRALSALGGMIDSAGAVPDRPASYAGKTA